MGISDARSKVRPDHERIERDLQERYPYSAFVSAENRQKPCQGDGSEDGGNNDGQAQQD